ncbi:RNA 2'-phosphotransferase [Spirosoma koreense]
MQNKKNVSKLLSLALRHNPAVLGLTLDEGGWASVEQLLSSLKHTQNDPLLNMAYLEELVATNDKQRFAFNEDRTRIRASQGHSILIDLGLLRQQPPDVLYHGTDTRDVPSILAEGIRKMSRQHVHLSLDMKTAQIVGARHGKPSLLRIDAKSMHERGNAFYRSANGVWLTDYVAPDFLQLLEPETR